MIALNASRASSSSVTTSTGLRPSPVSAGDSERNEGKSFSRVVWTAACSWRTTSIWDSSLTHLPEAASTTGTRRAWKASTGITSRMGTLGPTAIQGASMEGLRIMFAFTNTSSTLTADVRMRVASALVLPPSRSMS
jgi:predicted phage gp36 major capsid-like protein